ncbi:MAG: hypothetical protein WCS30_08920, partial [Selenomonadaceae bacterium]
MKQNVKTRAKRITALLLCILTCLSIIPASAFAVENHTHSENCYTKLLVCKIEEHIHTDECYTQICENTDENHEHSEECYALTCGKEEHTHTDDCYENVLICGLEETQTAETAQEEDSSDAGADVPEMYDIMPLATGSLATSVTITTDMSEKVDADDGKLTVNQLINFKIFYSMEQNAVHGGDYIEINIPDALAAAKLTYPQDHFASMEVVDGKWRLTFKDGAENFISGYINMTGQIIDNIDVTPTFDVIVNGSTVFTTEIKPIDYGTADIPYWTPFGKEILTDNNENVTTSGSIKNQTANIYADPINGIKQGDQLRYHIRIVTQKTMTNLIVNDYLPKELKLVEGSIVVDTASGNSGILTNAGNIPYTTTLNPDGGFTIHFDKIEHTGATSTTEKGIVYPTHA